MKNSKGKAIILVQSPEVRVFTRISTPPCLLDSKKGEEIMMREGCRNPCPCPCPCRCMCPCPRPR